MPSFFGCDHEVPLTPIPTCVSEENPSKYEVVTAGAYVQSRLEETYTVGEVLVKQDVAERLGIE